MSTEPARHGQDRRRVLSAGATGILTLALPTAAAHATGGDGTSQGFAAPTGVMAAPIGHVSGASTGAIRVRWDPVDGAASYVVTWSTVSVNGPYSDGTATTSGLTVDLTGLTGTDVGGGTVHHLVVTARTADGTPSLASQPVSSAAVIATGGTVSTFTSAGATDGTLTNGVGVTYVVHRFDASGEFRLNRPVAVASDLSAVEHLIVGGGGAGGSRHGGGGGAGGLATGAVTSFAQGPSTVTVGAGGIGRALDATDAASIAASTPAEAGDSTALGVTARRGGHGSGGSAYAPQSGGSGGGASFGSGIGGPGGADGTSGRGSAGGAGLVDPAAGGGGGGASAAGGDATAAGAGAGGAGRGSVIAGDTAVEYAGGGGGSVNPGASVPGGGGGAGGGGGGVNDGVGQAGDANTGGGGGAGGFDGATNFAGGDGGSGVVVLRYRLPTPSAPPA